MAGAANSGKNALVAGLETLLKSSGGEVSIESTDADCHVWTLSTKYYAADLEVHLLPSSEWNQPAEAAAKALAGAEALLVLLDATSRGSLAEAQAWVDQASVSDIGTLLCITNKVDIVTGVAPGEDSSSADELLTDAPASNADHVSFINSVTEWCLDAGFEHVQAAATSPLAGSAGRDKTGVPRVLEALECTMWNSMRRKGQQQAARDDAEEEEENDTGAEGQGASASAAPSGSAASFVAGPCVSVASASPTSAAAAGGSGDRSADALRDLLRGARGEGGDDDAGDDAGDDIERLMGEMQRVRDASRGAGMTDEQRREAASRVAMQLFALMGGGSSDDDGSDGEDS